MTSSSANPLPGSADLGAGFGSRLFLSDRLHADEVA